MNVLAMILAGGEGRRLDPLTRERAKPAVPFGGRYRIVDFVLSNLANSGFLKMKVLVQYKSESLNTHIQRAWRLTALLNQYVEIVPAQMRVGPKWFSGSADAIYQNLNIITDEEPEYLLVFGADNIYRMDVRQMLDLHLDRKADLTVAAIPVPVSEASEYGIIEVDAEGRMVGFVEKPKVGAKTMPGDPTRCLASMGNYLFTTDALVQEIVRDAGDPNSAHDFGKSIVASMYQRKRVFVYDFAKNVVPGQSERERGYWRDVGSIDAYYQANMDLVAVDPIFSLYNYEWPIYTVQYNYPPAKFVFRLENEGRVGQATDSLISEGCIISGGTVHHSIISPKVRINSYSLVEDSIVFENVNIGRHCKIRRAIVDKHVDIPAGSSIGYDLEKDRRQFHVSESGIVIIPKGMHIEPGEMSGPALSTLLRGAGRALLELLYPPRCAACGAPTEEEPFCPVCAEALLPVPPGCARCGQPGPEDPCGACRAVPPPFDAVLAGGLFGGPLADAVHAFKYGRRPALARPLGAWLAGRVPLPSGAAVVSVPLGRARRIERGYDQAALLADELARAARPPAPRLRAVLTRVRETPPQVGQDRARRAGNVAGAFQAQRPLSGRDLVLVDDVVTTGATAAAAAGALRAMGARSVVVVALARAE